MRQATLDPQSINVAGLDEPVEMLVDRYGVAHIFANSDRDVFLAQGFNAARDRLWQLDIWRRRGLGLLAQSFGPAYVERDRAARLLLYRGDMAPEWKAYGEDARGWIERFVCGINAYIARVEAEPERLPVEFVLTGSRPLRWSPEDVLRCRAHARVRNLDTEIGRANVAAQFGLEQAALVKKLDPPWTLQWPDGIAAEAIPPDVLATYRLATTLVDLSNATLSTDDSTTAHLDGSNNWALRPERTDSGRALLATDPHRLQEMPSLRYTVHLNAPGLNIIGSGEPAIPGVSLGHNERIAFGLTIFPTDQEDLYVYELDPNDASKYRYGDGWESMQEVTEHIEVRGAAASEQRLQFTRHGPVLHVDRKSNRAYALRTVWTEPGTAAYLASLRYQRAANWDDFVAAQDTWGAPSVNQVFADVEGNVGWITAGKLPVRPNWDGLLPVPGDGRYEWQGFMDTEHHPREFNPARGWVASANQMNLPADFDHAQHKTGFEFAPSGRFERISAVLEAKEKHSLADMKALQADVQCQAAKRLVALIEQLPNPQGPAAQAIETLSHWDFELTVESGAAALFEIWFRRFLIPATLTAAGSAQISKLLEVADTEWVIHLLRACDTRLGEDPRAIRDQLLSTTLASAWSEAEKLLGSDVQIWAWGTLHQVYLRHSLSSHLGGETAKQLNIGPLPKGGSAITVNNNGYRPQDFAVIHGVSWRMVADVGNWDACAMINSPGQSGDPASPHYADHFPLWAREEYVPMLFSRAAIEANLERHISLLPAD